MKAIARTSELLRGSKDSLYTHLGVDEVIAALQDIQNQFEQTGQLVENNSARFSAPLVRSRKFPSRMTGKQNF
jgi:hypothetical protein